MWAWWTELNWTYLCNNVSHCLSYAILKCWEVHCEHICYQCLSMCLYWTGLYYFQPELVYAKDMITTDSHWKVVRAEGRLVNATYNCCPDSIWHQLHVDLHVKRVSMLYAICFILPCVGKATCTMYNMLIYSYVRCWDILYASCVKRLMKTLIVTIVTFYYV